MTRAQKDVLAAFAVGLLRALAAQHAPAPRPKPVRRAPAPRRRRWRAMAARAARVLQTSATAPVALALVPAAAAPRVEVSTPPHSAAAPVASPPVSSSPATCPAAPTAPRRPEVSAANTTTRWATSCTARCAHTGRRCALPAGHRSPHASGRQQFTAVAPEGATDFRGAAQLEAAAHRRPEGPAYG